MKEQILDRLARLLKYFKGLEHENNEKEYAYILKGTINGITYSIKLNLNIIQLIGILRLVVITVLSIF